MQFAQAQPRSAAVWRSNPALLGVQRHAWRHLHTCGTAGPRFAALKRQQRRSSEMMVTCRATGILPTRRKQASSTRKSAQQLLPMPQPAEYQQTLRKSFTIGGIGLHTGEYAFVRVKPACPGEGRYFVRVPEGTNAERFQLQKPERLTAEEVGQLPTDDLSEDVRTGMFFEFLKAQEGGFQGGFEDFLEEVRAAEELAEYEQQQRQLVEEEAVPRSEGEGEWLPASIDMAVQQHAWSTVLGERENSILGAEHLLAALEACGVDNARIEIEGGYEVPIVDGSALGWCIEIQQAGLRPAGAPAAASASASAGEDGEGEGQDEGEAEVAAAAAAAAAGGVGDYKKAERTAPAPLQTFSVQEGQSFVAFFPAPTARLSVGLDRQALAPVIGRQWFSWTPEPAAPAEGAEEGASEHFRWEVAPARTTFDSIDGVLEALQRGELRGGPDYCSIIADGDQWEDDTAVRFPADEPARHAMIDLLGNLSLAARPGHRGLPVGHVVAFNASHDLQLRFVRELQSCCSRGQEFCDHPVVGC